MSVNKVIIVGHVGKDPEMRSTGSGKRLANLSVATSESWRDKASGERKEKTEWHRVVVFNDSTADFIEQYVRKGDLVYVEGQLQTRKWTDKDGSDRYSTEIVVQLGRVEQLSSNDKAPPKTNVRRGARSRGDDLEDEIPF